MLGVPGAAIQVFQGMLLFFLLAVDVLHQLPHAHRNERRSRDGSVGSINPVLLVASLMVAATPILLAAIGELVVERSGVLNLGVEGMMITGAIFGFAVGVEDRQRRRWASAAAALAARCCRWSSAC